jgi:hypothetical protein
MREMPNTPPTSASLDGRDLRPKPRHRLVQTLGRILRLFRLSRLQPNNCQAKAVARTSVCGVASSQPTQPALTVMSALVRPDRDGRVPRSGRPKGACAA